MSGRIESGPLSDVDREDELVYDMVGGRSPASVVSPTPSRSMGKLTGSVLRRESRRVDPKRGGTSEVANGVSSIGFTTPLVMRARIPGCGDAELSVLVSWSEEE